MDLVDTVRPPPPSSDSNERQLRHRDSERYSPRGYDTHDESKIPPPPSIDPPVPSLTDSRQAIYATRLLYIIGMGFVKMSLLWFYLRLDHRKLMKWAVYFSMFFTIGLTVSSVFVTVLSCIPPSKFWDPTGKKPGHCISPEQQQIFYEANGALNIVSDILIFLTPIPMLWGIQLSTVGAPHPFPGRSRRPQY